MEYVIHRDRNKEIRVLDWVEVDGKLHPKSKKTIYFKKEDKPSFEANTEELYKTRAKEYHDKFIKLVEEGGIERAVFEFHKHYYALGYYNDISEVCSDT